MISLRQAAIPADLGRSRTPAHSVGALALLALAVTTVAFVAGRPGTQTWVHVATPHFLSKALGPQLPRQSRGKLVPKRFVRPGYATPRINSNSFSLGRGRNSISLTSAAGTTAGWSRHAGGVSRSTSYGRTTITVGLNSIEQFLTVGRHFGSRTWTWNLSSLGMLPRLGRDEQIHFYKHGHLTHWRIARPLIQNGAGAFITPAGTGWQLSKRNGKWVLGLQLDDSHLPIPYTIDPAIALRGTCSISFAGNSSTTQAGCSASSSNANTLPLTVPSGVVNGDALIAQVDTRQTPSSPPAGFTALDTANGTTIFQQDAYRVANGETAGTTTYTFGDASSSPTGGAMYAFANTNTTTPVDQHTTNSGACAASGNCTLTASAVTTTQANEMPIALYTVMANTTLAQTAGQGLTQAVSVTTGGANGSKFAFLGSSGTNVQSSPGSTGSFTATFSNGSSQNWVASTLTLEPAFQADGAGTVSANRTNVAASSTGNTVQFTYTAAPTSGGTGGMNNGSVTVAVPNGWTAPVTSNAIGCTTASAGTLSVSGQTITVSNLTLAPSATLTITYGATSGGSCAAGDGATATGTTGAATWTVQSKGTTGGTLTNLTAGSPSITVNAANGSGTNAVSPTTVAAATTNNTLTFTYTAATGGTSNGEVDVAVPSGWTAPTTSNAAGCVSASTGTVSVSGSTIKVTGVTLSGGGTMTIAYGATSGGSCTASDTATAPATAQSSTFTTSERSTNNANDSLTNIASSPSVSVNYAADGSGTAAIAPTSQVAGASGLTETLTYTETVAGGMNSGAVEVTVPANWSAPSVTNGDPGCTVASTGTVGVSGQVITVTGVTLAQNATLTITYGAKTGACSSSTGASAPGAGNSGSATWSVRQKSSSGGTLTALGSSPSVNVTSAADGSGTAAIAPTSQAASSSGLTETLTYTETVAGGMNSGAVELTVPANWSAPSTTNGNAGCTTASTGSVGVSGQVITVTGVTLAQNATLTITYGATTGACSSSTGASDPAAGNSGSATWSVRQKSTSGGTLTALGSSPSVNVTNAADGTGTIGVSPTSISVDTTGATFTFGYTPIAGGTKNGKVRVQVPSGWTTPSTSNTTAGYTTAGGGSGADTVSIDTSTSPCSASTPCILVSGVTLTPSQTLTITYGSGGGATGVTVPGSTGTATFTTTEASTSGGTLSGASITSPTVTLVNGNFSTTTAVAINGTPTVGTASTLTAGTYTPTPTGRSYQWRLCDSSGSNCADISGATNSTYTPVAGDVGSTLRVVETVTKANYNNGGSTSAASAVVVKGTFTTNTAVAINGTPTVGTASTLTAGSYTPAPTGQSYQWQLCNSSGASCLNISGATSNTYTPVATDVGSTLRVVETVSKAGYNNGGSTSAASPVVVNGSFVTNTTVAINGTPTVGTASTLTAGSYTPSPTSSSYQWRQCDSAGNSCANISGATGSTYTPVAGDVGHTLRVVETVSKSGYNNGSSTSAASPLVINGSFVTNTAVAINGTPTVGTASTLTAGSYTPTPTGQSYQWQLCDSSGNSCSNIGGATSSTYTPVAGDVGSTLRVVESVSKAGYNNGGSTSAASAVVIKGDFSTTAAVAINGTPTVGTASTLTAGTYNPTPTTRAYQWELCDSSGNSCSNIGGATNSTYTPVAGDVGSTLRVVETASKAGYNDGGSTSAASAIVVKGNFSTTTAVAINGTPTVGTASTLTAGSYTPAPTSSAYQWRLCNNLGASCSDISGATSNTYTPVAGDVGGTLRVVETVSRAGYNDGTSTSAASPVVVKGNFVTNAAVSINGTPTVGTASTLTAGSYTPAPTGQSYQWQLCNSLGASCSNISGATSTTYTPVASDVGSTLRVVETVSRAGYNDGGSISAASAIVIKADFATNSAVSVSGTPTVGTASSLTAGSYTPAPTSSAYQWQLCDSSGNSCANISGATSSTYTPVAGDVGSTLRVVETVSRSGYNDGGSTSAASAVVIKGDFSTSTAVSVSGTPTVGTASASIAGSYSPSPTSSAYQWELCDGSGNNCSDISGATSSSYTPVAGDVGSTLRVVETVSRAGYNDGGSTSSASSAVIKGDFVTTSTPSINGRPVVGTLVTITNGVYSVTATSRSHQWQLCDSGGANCTDISGATTNSYTPVAGDLGSTLRVVETVSRAGYNDGGSTSDASGTVVVGLITTSTPVAINGTPRVDAMSTSTAGSYSPTPTSVSYQWRLCDSGGSNCSNIAGATSSSYMPVAADAGSTLRLVETASKAAYADGISTSAASPVVLKANFTTNSAVTITGGTPKVAASSTIAAGSYSPSPAGQSYQWEKCDSAGANCSNIGGATTTSYTPVAGDVGSTLRVVETVTKAGYNAGSSTSSASAVVIKASFSTNTAVSVNGTPQVGATSHLTAGAYSPAPTSLSYQWQSCDSSGNNCSNISGATGKTYTPIPGDVGSTMRVVETVSKAGYNNGSSTSAASPAVIKGNVTTTTAIAINAQPTVGSQTTTTIGVYAPSPTSRSYQWELCDTAGNNCANIAGATSTTYTPVSGQVGSTLRVVETASLVGYNDSTSTSNAVVVDGIFGTTTPVAISGSPVVGTQLKSTAGTYSPAPTGRTYQWKRCDHAGNNCVKISGATFNVYTPVAADVGKRLRVVETVTKSLYASGSSTSAPSGTVAMGTFVMNTAVAVFGFPKHGVTTHITPGSYTPTPAHRTYKWLRCGSLLLSSCTTISGATSSSYKPVAGDVGKRLRVVETVSKPGFHNLVVTSVASTKVT